MLVANITEPSGLITGLFRAYFSPSLFHFSPFDSYYSPTDVHMCTLWMVTGQTGQTGTTYCNTALHLKWATCCNIKHSMMSQKSMETYEIWLTMSNLLYILKHVLITRSWQQGKEMIKAYITKCMCEHIFTHLLIP